MEKTLIPKQPSEINISKRAIWDCGSSLYDSFELKSFEKQLDSAISARTLSMPHLSDRRQHDQPPPPSKKKPTSKISRSLNRFLRSVFRPKSNKNSTYDNAKFVGEAGFSQEQSKDHQAGFYVVYHDKSDAAVYKIPEKPEFDHGFSPEIGSLVTRRTASDRFSVPTSVGIYCA